MEHKLDRLREILKSYGKVAVAFSGGVDSVFLMAVAAQTLGDDCIAITAESPSFPKRERREAEEFCKSRGIRQYTFESREIELQEYAANPMDRCYICKKALFSAMGKIAKEQEMDILVEGSNKDDEGDYRPGLRAIAELGIASPLREAEFYKEEIRALSKEMGLATWEKASFACLATRLPYGETVTRKKLSMIERAEDALAKAGFYQYRARYVPRSDGGASVRIEVLPEEFERFVDAKTRDYVVDACKEAGFLRVVMDLEGYRMGNMNQEVR